MQDAGRILLLEVDGERWRGRGQQPVTVGSGDCSVAVGGPGVSALHLVAEVRAGRWVLVDRSRYGTYLDGVRLRELTIEQPVALRLGHPRRGPQLRLALDSPYARAAESAHPTMLVPSPAEDLDVVHLRCGEAQVQVRAGTTAWIGRAPGADLQVEHPSVSRHHLRVLQCGDRWLAVDDGSQRGTFLGGRRRSSVRLERRTVFRLGGRTGPAVVAEVGGTAGEGASVRRRWRRP